MNFIKKKILQITPYAVLDIYSNAKKSIISKKYILQIEPYVKCNNMPFSAEIDFLKRKKKLTAFPYAYTEEYNWRDIHVLFDSQKNLPYIVYNNKKLYFPKAFSKREVAQTYNSLLLEQDVKSPHKYFNHIVNFKEGAVFFDVGVAEGFISLDIVEKSKAVYILNVKKYGKNL